MEDLVSTEGFYRGRRIFVTGDTGFKGSWLCYWLSLLGAEVLGYALPPENGEVHYALLGMEKYIRHVDGDIRDGSKLSAAVRDFRPEVVFHLAAQSLVRLSYLEPAGTFETNVCGSVNLLEAVRACESVRSLIYVTSDKCYRNKEWYWGYRENDELGGHDPYSASKAAAEIAFSSYMDSFFAQRTGFGGASVRAGNVIGGGDWSADRIVPDCFRALRENKAIVLRSPSAVRPWQHVLDPLFGYMMLAKKIYFEPDLYSGSWNFGPAAQSIRTVAELVNTLLGLWGESHSAIEIRGEPLHEAGLLILNCDKAHHLLGWSPRWGFERSVEQTVLWYRGLHLGQPAEELTRKQIMEYMEGRHD
jgi:CDP-glucose 4,6-dehydratase